MTPFSKRQGLEVPDAAITIRHEAPPWLRTLLKDTAYEMGLRPSELRTILCRILLESPNAGNWSEHPNIDFEVDELMCNAPWFHIYDLSEEIYAVLAKRGADGVPASEFLTKLNLIFRRKGVGWQLVDRQVQMRGPEIFEQTARAAVELATKSGREIARHELQEALHDLSRRPKPELTGAIQHAMAALECIARDEPESNADLPVQVHAVFRDVRKFI